MRAARLPEAGWRRDGFAAVIRGAVAATILCQKTENPKSRQNIHFNFHGQNWNHRCFDLRHFVWRLVFRDAKAGSALAATTGGICQRQTLFQRRQTAASPAAIPSTATTTPSVQIFDTNAPENTVVISNADARYTFTSRGGGLKSIELLKYPETISARWKKEWRQQRRGHVERARVGSGSCDFGRHQFGRRRQFHLDAERTTASARKNHCRTACCS